VTRRRLALLGGLLGLVAASAVVVVATTRSDEASAQMPAPHNGRFHVECAYSHSGPDDPIVFPGEPGQSHLHNFFGATTTDAFSDVDDLVGGDTTCATRQDTAAYWAPALLDGDREIEPISSIAYYRAAPGVDPEEVQPFPLGLMMIGGDAASTSPQPTDIVGWACTVGATPQVSPPPCRGGVLMQIVFPDCWDGEHLDSADHRSHLARSTASGCPADHPVALPQLEFHVNYPLPPDLSGLRLASGSLLTGHADFFNAWDPDKLAEEVRYCIHEDAYC
jgi:Domain of unknown function (DUF1996)